MKTFLFLSLLFGLSSCQYATVSLLNGREVQITTHRIYVVDSLDNFKILPLVGALKEFNKYNDVYKLLKLAGDQSLGLGLIHTQPTKRYMKKMKKNLLSRR